MSNTNPILLYDGSCGFCQQSVQFVLQHERTDEVLFAPLQSDFARQIIAKHPWLNDIDSIVFILGKDVLVESDAVWALASYLRAPYGNAKLIRIIPKGLRDTAYRFVAKHRKRLIRHGNEACLLPTPEQRKRFLS